MRLKRAMDRNSWLLATTTRPPGRSIPSLWSSPLDCRHLSQRERWFYDSFPQRHFDPSRWLKSAGTIRPPSTVRFPEPLPPNLSQNIAHQAQLSLDEAVRQALESRVSLKAEAERVPAAEGLRKQAGLFPPESRRPTSGRIWPPLTRFQSSCRTASILSTRLSEPSQARLEFTPVRWMESALFACSPTHRVQSTQERNHPVEAGISSSGVAAR
jgi:hypothetical protein